MSDTELEKAIERYGAQLGVDTDGEVVLESVFRQLERDGVVEITDGDDG